MKGKRILISVLALGLMLALAVGLTQAQEPGPQGEVGVKAVPGGATASAPPVLSSVEGLSTSFTYQGRLTDGGGPANGSYDFQFKLYDAASGGGWVGTIAKDDVTVTDGLFTVELDFGSTPFMGDARWLEIGVRPGASAGAYTTLTPRQALTAAPYALYALGAPWSGLAGVPPDFADGVDDDTLGGLSCGNGQVAKWNNTSSQWQCGNDETSAGGGGWSLTGDAGTNPTTNFLGTTDDQALELRVNNARALRLEPNADSPNLIGGYSGNSVTSGVVGAAIGGGGAPTDAGGGPYPNRVTDDYGTVGGGESNQAGDNAGATGDAPHSTVAGGLGNTASGATGSNGGVATVGGGAWNAASGGGATIGGGVSNVASGDEATIGGGWGNTASGDAATVGGGGGNTAGDDYATVAGGGHNTASGLGAVVAGGGGFDPFLSEVVTNTASGDWSTISGGKKNTAMGWGATVGGGNNNTAHGSGATIGGGGGNTASSWGATASGGDYSTASGVYGTVGGGCNNTASGYAATVGGGYLNHADALTVTIGGGEYISVTGQAATVAGGSYITVTGEYAAVGGGLHNTVNGEGATIGGGGFNTASGGGATIGGGSINTASGGGATIGGGAGNVVTGTLATVGGGLFNAATADYATVGGGVGNVVTATNATVGGGGGNAVTGTGATVGGGEYNFASGFYAAIGGGEFNIASGYDAIVGGGNSNTASGDGATVGGGDSNTASSDRATVGGGSVNTASGHNATVGGGNWNEASGEGATVPGGLLNVAQGEYSFAAGRRAKANHDGAFVWADSTDADFESMGANEFRVRATNGAEFSGNNTWYGLQVDNDGNGDGIRAYASVSQGAGWGAVYAINNGTSPAVYANTGGTYSGYFMDDIYVEGSCVGCGLVYIGLNDGSQSLETGDLVAVSGVSSPLAGATTPVIRVRRAGTGSASGVIGVVQGKADVVESSKDGQLLESANRAEGAAAPGDYVFIVVQGIAHVKADATAGDIVAGQRLTVASRSGHVRALRTRMLEGMMVTEGAPVIGIALAPLDKDTGTIPVLVTLR